MFDKINISSLYGYWMGASPYYVFFNNMEKYNKLRIEFASNRFALDDIEILYDKNNLLKKKIKKFSSINYDLYYKKIKRYRETHLISKKNRGINHKNKLKILNLKDDEVINDYLNKFIDLCFYDEEEKLFKEYVWGFIEFIFSLYYKYEDYLNKDETTIDNIIIDNIIDFTNEQNKKLPNLSYLTIFSIFISGQNNRFFLDTNPLFVTIEKRNNKYYLFRINNDNTDTYIINEIKDINKLKKLQIIFYIFQIRDFDCYFTKYIKDKSTSLLEEYNELLKTLIGPDEIHYF
jgi:hypothetical protein